MTSLLTLSETPTHAAERACLEELLAAFDSLARTNPDFGVEQLGTVGESDESGRIVRYSWRGPKGGADHFKLGFFAGIHGDEPAGSWALLDFARSLFAEPELGAGFEFHFYPVLNPTGFIRGTRENAAGLDLNREFWRGSAQPEVRLLEPEIAAQVFDGVIALHADDTSHGLYGYARGHLLAEELLRPALAAAAEILPANLNDIIDGFRAERGLIRDCFEGVLAAPPSQRPQPFDIIFETPALAVLDLQREATVRALHTVIANHRRFIAYAAGL